MCYNCKLSDEFRRKLPALLFCMHAVAVFNLVVTDPLGLIRTFTVGSTMFSKHGFFRNYSAVLKQLRTIVERRTRN